MLNIILNKKNRINSQDNSSDATPIPTTTLKNYTQDALPIYTSNLQINSLDTLPIYNKQNFTNKIQDKLDKSEYKNIIYYPSSTKEWFSSIYSYNKSYTKPLISIDSLVNSLFLKYFNMLNYKINYPLKRRRPNRIRNSANKIFISRAEFKHTNSKLTILVYAYNKKKLSIEKYLNEVNNLISSEEKMNVKEIQKITKNESRLALLLKEKLLFFKKWTNNFLVINNNSLNHIMLNLKKKDLNLQNIPYNSYLLSSERNTLEQILFNTIKEMNFNKLKFTNLFTNLCQLGITSVLKKIYGKNVEIKLVELKSIHLNSDIFTSVVALKLRNRHNKVVRVLKKAILFMVRIPDLHTLRTFDENKETINKKNILNVINQQVVSGVRFEAAGRLTKRLTAMRAVFKVRYVGGLKNIRSSLNGKPSTILRGHVKSTLQHTIINTKTRNGSFGLKGWVSSH
jgi:hypothetical protein